jgi:excisionase family DNA binding protein
VEPPGSSRARSTEGVPHAVPRRTEGRGGVALGAAAPQRRPLTWTVAEAADLLGISRTSAYEAAHCGELPVKVIGRRMLVPRVALLRLLDAHEAEHA